jgi:hypothetical protein
MNNKQQFTLKKDQKGTLLLCGISHQAILPTTLILKIATDDQPFLEKEYHVVPRFQASQYQGSLSVSKDDTKVNLPLDLSYTYKCSHGTI